MGAAPRLEASSSQSLATIGHGNYSTTDLLVFALNQEYLAATFFSYAAWGHGLPSKLTGGGPPPRGARKAKLTGPVQKMAAAVAADEIAHVRLLRNALGDAAVAMPLLDLATPFREGAELASQLWRHGRSLAPPFDPYASDTEFLLAAFFLADLEPSAYTGLVAALSGSEPEVQQLAAQLLSVEAYHAGAVRGMLVPLATRRLWPRDVTVAEMASLFAKLRSRFDQSAMYGQGVDCCGGLVGMCDTDEDYNRAGRRVTLAASGRTPTRIGVEDNVEADNMDAMGDHEDAHDCGLFGRCGLPVVAPRDNNGLGFVRSVEEVRAVLYSASPYEGGGFFPEGLAGEIR
ncbi:ferritin-like domain-containing protein [Haematococcus lacustris]